MKAGSINRKTGRQAVLVGSQGMEGNMEIEPSWQKKSWLQSRVQCTVDRVLYSVHWTMYCTVYSGQCTVLLTVYCSVDSVQCTVYIGQCTVQCIVDSVLCSGQWTLDCTLYCTLYSG